MAKNIRLTREARAVAREFPRWPLTGMYPSSEGTLYQFWAGAGTTVVVLVDHDGGTSIHQILEA